MSGESWLYDFSNVGYVQADNRTSWLYDFSNVGATTPTDGRSYLYDFCDVKAGLTPEPHIWFVRPTYGKEGWEFDIVGYGFGATQATWSALVKLNAVTCPVDLWLDVPSEPWPHTIDESTNTADPPHQRVTCQVPVGGQSGPITVQTDGP